MSTVNKILVGVAVGAILGVLYAPDKGSITRRKLSIRGNDLRDSLNNFKDAVNDRIDDFKEDINDIAYDEMSVPNSDIVSRPQTW